MHGLISLLFFVAVSAATTPAVALPIIFTDRAAFDAYVGGYTLLTLDAPDELDIHYPAATATYGDLITFHFDYPSGYGVFPGVVIIGNTGLAASGEVLQPVKAFGFDILSAEVAGSVPSFPGFFASSGFTFSAAGLHFLGIASDTPFTANISFMTSTLTIDNIAIKTVPEPSSVIFVMLALVGLIVWLWRDPRLNARHSLSPFFVILLAAMPLQVEASQIVPNPNPAGSTIDIINDPTAFNNANPFSNGGTINIDSSSTFTNSVGANLQNTGLGTLTNAGSVNNYGAITGNVTSSGTINNFGALGGLSPVTLVNAVGGTVNNYGGISTGPFGGLISNAGTLNNFAGSGIVAGFTGGGIGNTGTLNNFAGASIFMADNTFVNSVGAVLNNAGSMDLSPAILFTNNGTFINSGSFRCCGGPILGFVFTNSAGATMINSGVIYAGSGNLGFGNSGTLINAGSITGSSYNFGSNVLINTGTIDQVRSFTSSGLTINNGTITAESASIGGILKGTGTINGPVDVASGAIFAPGDATTLGKFTIHGNLQSSGDLLFRIQGLNVGEFDVLDISDTATFTGGTMRFSFGGYDPKIGESWDFLYASAISGWDNLTFLFTGLDPTERAMFHFHDGIETLRIVAVPEPGSIFLFSAALAGMAGWRRLS